MSNEDSKQLLSIMKEINDDESHTIEIRSISLEHTIRILDNMRRPFDDLKSIDFNNNNSIYISYSNDTDNYLRSQIFHKPDKSFFNLEKDRQFIIDTILALT